MVVVIHFRNLINFINLLFKQYYKLCKTKLEWLNKYSYLFSNIIEFKTMFENWCLF